jgi:endonuclease V
MGDTDADELKARWEAEQLRMCERIVKHDDASWTVAAAPAVIIGELQHPDAAAGTLRTLRVIAGVDISFSLGSNENACATLVVLSWPELDVVYETSSRVTMDQPYIAGYLAFREVGHLAALVARMRLERPDLDVDIVFVDGNGILHPRGAGLASHLGVLCNLRTIGIGKTFLHVDGLTKPRVRELVTAAAAAAAAASNDSSNSTSSGSSSSSSIAVNLVGDSGAVWGAALCCSGTVNPIYVSIGHRVSLSTAVALTQLTCRYRVPEAVRQADIRSRETVRDWGAQQAADVG